MRNNIVLILFALFVFNKGLNAQVSFDQSMTPSQLVNNILLGGGVSVSNVYYSGGSQSIGKFTNASQPNLFSDGIILGTGNINIYNRANSTGGGGNDKGKSGDIDLNGVIGGSTFDATVLQFDFVPNETPVTFSYVFASEEYNEFVCSGYNDVFAFFVTGENPSGGFYNKKNVALIPGTSTPVAINSVNKGVVGSHGSLGGCTSLSHSDKFVDNTGGAFLEFDGLTKELQASFDVVPGKLYTIKIAVADVGDGSYDSGVFLKGGSFSSPVVTGIPDNCPVNPQDVDYPSKWYLGHGKAGLTWTRSDNPTITNDAGFQIYEAVTSVTDQAGDLLFYSDGLKVYDKNHVIMPNGDGLEGSFEFEENPFQGSSLNGAIAVNKPGDPSQYYIFTTPSVILANEKYISDGPEPLTKAGGTTGIKYHIVDLNAPGNGSDLDPLGDVISKNNTLLEEAGEMLVATGDGCGNVWIIGHSPTGNKFHSYLLTEEGISNYFVSEVGPDLQMVNGFIDEARGSGDANPEGNKIAFGFSNGIGGYLFDFNKKTGELSNESKVVNGSAYGCEFSPNGENVYFSFVGNGNIERFDLSEGLVEIVGTTSNGSYGDLEKGIDGKIYIGRVHPGSPSITNLSIINNPNDENAANVGFVENGIDLGVYTNPGLPQTYFYGRNNPSKGEVIVETNCIDEVSNFHISTSFPSDVVSYYWDMGDGTIYENVLSTSHQYSSTGRYDVKFFVERAGECDCDYTLEKRVYISPCKNCEDCVPSYAPTPGEKYTISAWVKEDKKGVLTYENAAIVLDYEGWGLDGPILAKGAIIDGWQRIEYTFVIPVDASAINVKLVNLGFGEVYFDDVRVHPFNSNMKSFVYDPTTLRLHAELDENNYATMYEYDEEGALVRVKKETERGVKTINETRQNLSKQK